jgi:hypothetical protein
MTARVPDGAVARKAGTARAADIRARPRMAHSDRNGPSVAGIVIKYGN